MASDAKLRAALAKINKRYGSEVAIQASKSLVLNIPRLPTGVFSIDLAMGGGVPMGRISRFLGPFSAGKSWLCQRVMSHNKNRLFRPDPKTNRRSRFRTLWQDAEGAWDNSWAETLDVDLDEVYVVRTEFAEQGIDTTIALLEQHLFDFFVVDSLPALVPMKELESSAEDLRNNPGGAALLGNSFMRKIVAAHATIKEAEKPAIVLINSPRSTFDKYDAEFFPGGKMQGPASSMDFHVERRKVLTDKGHWLGVGEWNDDKGQAVAAKSRFLIKKNKTAPANRSGTWTLWFADDSKSGKKAGDVDCSDAVFEYAQRYGLIAKNKKEFIRTDTEETIKIAGKDEVATKKEQVSEAIFHDTNLALTLGDAIIEKATKKVSKEEMLSEEEESE